MRAVLLILLVPVELLAEADKGVLSLSTDEPESSSVSISKASRTAAASSCHRNAGSRSNEELPGRRIGVA